MSIALVIISIFRIVDKQATTAADDREGGDKGNWGLGKGVNWVVAWSGDREQLKSIRSPIAEWFHH